MADYDHQTHEIRGLLCERCNYALGCLEDGVNEVANALDYLFNYLRQRVD